MYCRALLICLLLASASARGQDAASVTRAKVWVDETQLVPSEGVQEFVVVEPSVLQARRKANGLELSGRAPGRTQIQIYRHDGSMQVMLVVVERKPAPKPSGSSTRSAGARTPLKSFFGANAITSEAHTNSSQGFWTTHALHLSGIAKKGEYSADAVGTIGSLGNQMLRARVGWMDATRTAGFELGDSYLQLASSRLMPSSPLLGLQLKRVTEGAAQELYVGSLSTLSDSRPGMPVVGFGIHSLPPPRSLPEFSHAFHHDTTGLAFIEPSVGSGRGGVLLGQRMAWEHRSGFSFEVTGSGVAMRDPQRWDASPLGVEGGLKASYLESTVRSGHLSYKFAAGSLFLPASRDYWAPQHRLETHFTQKLRPGAHLTTAAGYSWVETQWGYATGYNALLGIQTALSKQTVAGLQASLTGGQLPLEGQRSAARRQAVIALAGQHHFESGVDSRLSLQYQNATTELARSQGLALAGQAVQRLPRNWQWSADAMVGGYQQTHLAEDSPPLTLQASAGGAATWLTDFSAVSLGSRVERALLGPASSNGTGLSVNVGVQFAPTVAHRVGANFSLTRYVGTDIGRYAASVSYTYQFGDSIQGPSLIEFFSPGSLEGVVCVDDDYDGQCAPNEERLPNIEVRLSNGSHTLSDAQGRYAFARLKPGCYQVAVDEKKLRTLGRLTSAPTKGVDVVKSAKLQESFTVRKACDIVGRVVHDLDLDGARTDRDAFQAGVQIRATGPAGAFTAVTDSYGSFNLDVRQCGEYTVEVLPGSLPASMRVVTGTATVTALSTETPDVQLWVSAVRTIEGSVYLDLNANGRREPGEPPVAKAKVLWERGQAVTNEQGRFVLRKLPAGNVSLSVVPEPGSASTATAQSVRTLTLPSLPVAVEGVELSLTPAHVEEQRRRPRG